MNWAAWASNCQALQLTPTYDGAVAQRDRQGRRAGWRQHSRWTAVSPAKARTSRAEFRNLLLFNRDGDHARGTGQLVLADSAETLGA
jgi:hypothetical protein